MTLLSPEYCQIECKQKLINVSSKLTFFCLREWWMKTRRLQRSRGSISKTPWSLPGAPLPTMISGSTKCLPRNCRPHEDLDKTSGSLIQSILSLFHPERERQREVERSNPPFQLRRIVCRFPEAQHPQGGAGGGAPPSGGDQLGDDGEDDLYSWRKGSNSL